MPSSPLGRGLGSLIPGAVGTTTTSPSVSAGVHRIPLSSVRPNPRQPRSHISHEGLEELITSVKEHGILQPLVVTPKGREYEIIAGERRYQAAKMAGLKSLPVIIRDVTEQQQLELSLVENLQREDLNPLEEAEAYQRLLDEFNLTQEDVAKRVGKSRSYVANTLRLRNLPEEAKKAILNGRISAGHAKVMLSLATPEEQHAFLERILKEGLTVRASEVLAQRHQRPKASRRTATSNPLQSEEEALQRALGTKVSIQLSGGQGKIIITFFSREELTALLHHLTADNDHG